MRLTPEGWLSGRRRQSRKLLRSFEDESYHDIHSLTLVQENGSEYIYGSRNNHAEVIKMDSKGDIVLRIPFPAESGNSGKFKPTAVAVSSDGNILVADGYGSNFIYQFDHF